MKNISAAYFFSFALIFVLTGIQVAVAQKSSSDKQIAQAQKKAGKEKYEDAINILLEVTKTDSANPKAWYYLADVYFKIRDYVSAKNNFRKAYDIDPLIVPQASYYYALMLKMNGEYAEAKNVFQQFIKNYKVQDNYVAWAKTEITGCDLALNRTENENDEALIIKHLPQGINSRFSEMGPMFWDDSTLFYASLPKDTIMLITGDTGMDHHIKFYLADFKNDSFYNPLRVDDFNVPHSSSVSGTLSANKKIFYFGACNDWEYGTTLCQIFESKFQNGRWYEPERMESPLNDLRYNSNHPSMGFLTKGKQVLYFSSDRAGGKGGKDIWFSIITPDGKFSTPVNAGAINTSRDEITPFYDNLNGVLYFSSDGHVGYGGLDVFKATGERNVWTDIENVDLPINSSVDDLYFSFNPKKNNGLLVSNRSELNVSGSTCCDDIFYVKYQKPKKLAVMGFIHESTDNSKLPLTMARISLSFIDSAGDAVLLKEKTTEADEPYYFALKPDLNYSLNIFREGFFNKTLSISTIGKSAPDTIRFDIALEKIVEEKTYRLGNIYYKYNDFTLLPESKTTLDTLFEILQETPSINIEISSHTDSRGADNYNLTLSQKRAQNCVNYLIEKGISASRLKAIGYGEALPLQDCSAVDSCGENEKDDCSCHQLNRRTEFKVVKVKKVIIEEE